MTHKHDQGCEHDLKFCYQCDVPYCGKCDVSWSRHQPPWFGMGGVTHPRWTYTTAPATASPVTGWDWAAHRNHGGAA